jgi:hypothetical protein
MHTTPQDRAARIAERVLQYDLAQQFPCTTTTALIDISRGSTTIDAADAHRLALLALAIVMDAEIRAGREARQ